MVKEKSKKTTGKAQNKKKVVSKNTTVNSKKVVLVKQEKSNKKVYMIIAAIVILIIILLSLFGCENKNDIEKLQGSVNKEEVKDEDEKANEDDKVDEESTDVFEEHKEVFYVSTNNTESKEGISSSDVVTEMDEELRKLEAAKEAVEKAEDTLDKEDILKADDLVNDLKDSEEKDELEERLEDVKEAYNVKELVEKLEKLAYEAEDKRQVQVAKDFRSDNDIINLVENLKEQDLKEELKERLKKLEPILDDTTDPIITNVEEGKYYNTKVKPGVIEENIRSIKVNGEEYAIGQNLEDGIYTIVVVDMAFNDANCSFVIDTTKPELTLVGEENITLEYNKDTYEEKGVLYNDNIDGDKDILAPTVITKDGVEVASVDNRIVGEYTLTYEASDIAGNTNSITRKVTVKDTILPEAIAIAYYKNGTYRVVLSNISEELVNDLSWIDEGDTLEKTFDVLPENITITDVNGNNNVVSVEKEKNTPQIIVNVTNKEDYKSEYSFDITDDSDIEIVKIAEGAYIKEHFSKNGIVLTDYSYIAYKNGDYTVYAKDMMGNEIVKTFTVENIKEPIITLNGSKDVVLEYKTGSYTEEGATYYNNVSAPGYINNPTKITKDEIEVSKVDVNSVGIYKLEYTTTDKLGAVLTVVRTVTVKDTVIPTATATAYMINGKYIVKLASISEEIINDGSWVNNSKEFDLLPTNITITDVNGNSNEIDVVIETNAPVISEKVTNSDLYSKNYEFNITDDSDIEIVKIANGNQSKDYFASNGTEFISPYNYSIYENGDYTVYAKDKLGNETVKVITVSDIVTAVITDEELRNAFIEGQRVCNGINCEKTMTINSENTFEITEIKYVSTTAKDTLLPNKKVTVDSFKANKINGSDVVTLLLPLNEFKIKHENWGVDSRYYYIYYKAEKGTGTNKVTREYVIEVEPADGIL